MANEQNLRPCEYKLSQEEAKRGGIASGKARREKKHGKELARLILAEGLKDEKVKAALREAGHNPDGMDNETAMLLRQIEKALKTGDTKAFAAVMKAAGYDETNVNIKGVAPIEAKNEKDAEEIRVMLDNIKDRKGE